MALTFSALTTGSDTTVTTGFTTASVTPTGTRLQLIFVVAGFATASLASAPTSITGNGLTWTKCTQGEIVDTAAGIACSWWRATGASPTTGAITITYGSNVNRSNWSIFEIDGADLGGTNASNAVVQGATNSNITGTLNTITATLSAFGSASNGAVSGHAWFNVNPGPTATPDTGWTEVHETAAVGGSTTVAEETQFVASNDTTALCTWSSNGAIYATALEIKAAGTGVNYTLISAQGSFTSSGQAANFIRSVSLISEQGSFSVVGSESFADYAINAAQGSYSLTGQDAILIYTPAAGGVAYTLTAAQGSFTYTGQNAGQLLSISCIRGTYVLNGQNASLIWSGAPISPYKPKQCLAMKIGLSF